MELFHSFAQFSVPQIEYHVGGISKKSIHVNFLLIVAMVLLLWRQIVILWHQVTMVTSEKHLYPTIVLARKRATGSIHDYLFCYCPLVGIWGSENYNETNYAVYNSNVKTVRTISHNVCSWYTTVIFKMVSVHMFGSLCEVSIDWLPVRLNCVLKCHVISYMYISGE